MAHQPPDDIGKQQQQEGEEDQPAKKERLRENETLLLAKGLVANNQLEYLEKLFLEDQVYKI